MTRGKKILTILAVVFAVILGAGVWIYHGVHEAQDELNAIAEPMIRDMAQSQWNEAVIEKYASPQMKHWMETNKLTNGMPGLSVLGNVKEYDGVQSFTKNANFALLMVKVKFDSGDAYIRLGLCSCDGQWLMNEFNINSPALFQNVAGAQNAK